MFDRFTERARQVVVLAQEEARTLRFGQIGSEALLLGLLRVEDGLAARTLASLGVTIENARLAVTRYVTSGDQPVDGQMPFTPRATEVLHRANTERVAVGHQYVGTEHILLALVTVDEGVGMNILRDFAVDPTTIRHTVIQHLARLTPRTRRIPPAPQGSRTRWRRARGAEAGPSTGPFHGFDVHPDNEVTAILIGAAARALEDGRTETTVGDLLITLARAERLRPLLPEMAGGEAQIRAALQRLDPDAPLSSSTDRPASAQ